MLRALGCMLRSCLRIFLIRARTARGAMLPSPSSSRYGTSAAQSSSSSYWSFLPNPLPSENAFAGYCASPNALQKKLHDPPDMHLWRLCSKPPPFSAILVISDHFLAWTETLDCLCTTGSKPLRALTLLHASRDANTGSMIRKVHANFGRQVT